MVILITRSFQNKRMDNTFMSKQQIGVLLEVFQNEILASCQQKYLNVEVILISESMNSEIRITSTFRPVCQAGRLPGFHFENIHCRPEPSVRNKKRVYFWQSVFYLQNLPE